MRSSPPSRPLCTALACAMPRAEKSVHRVAVGGGACADGMAEALAAGCDTFVTADVKYNQFWDAADSGLNLIDAGHFLHGKPRLCLSGGKITCRLPGGFCENLPKSPGLHEILLKIG